MKTQTNILKGALTALLLGWASASNAGCFSNCEAPKKTNPQATKIMQSQTSTTTSTQNKDSYNRSKSHNANGNDNTMMGDMSIHVGHNSMTIGSVEKNSKVDNSISSSIILGDVQQ